MLQPPRGGKASPDAGQFFNEKEIQAAAKAQGVEIREGDVVLFHTGWTDAKLKSDPKAWVSGEPGLGESGAVQMIINPVAIY